MNDDLQQSQTVDLLDDAGASRVDGRWSPCRVCLLILVLLHPEVANLLIGV